MNPNKATNMVMLNMTPTAATAVCLILANIKAFESSMIKDHFMV
jgi:hypothetical protein